MIEICSVVIKTVSMIPSYRVFGANRVSRCPSLLIAYRVQKRQVKSVPLAPASKERLPKDSTTRRGSLRLAACLVVSVLTWSALSLHRRAARIAACIYDPEFRHQRNLSHRDPWQQRHRKLRDSGHHRNRGGSSTIFRLVSGRRLQRRQQTAPTSRERSFPRLMAPAVPLNSAFLRAVGSYETQSSSPYHFGYLYDGAARPNGNER